MKLLVSPKNKLHLQKLLQKDIDGVILYVDHLSVNSDYYIDIKLLDEINFFKKEVFISLNKIMHNSDLPELRKVIQYLKDKDVHIMFYDMAVYEIAKEYQMVNRLVIYQDHLNASIESNNFYYDLGIKGSFITNDITYQELIDIKKQTKMKIFFLGYGYQPIFYSRRYLLSNFLKYHLQDRDSHYKMISDDKQYPINEEEYGTTIYTQKPINLINYQEQLQSLDYLVLNSVNLPPDEFNLMLDKFIKKEKVKDSYLGFFNTKTTYKLK